MRRTADSLRCARPAGLNCNTCGRRTRSSTDAGACRQRRLHRIQVRRALLGRHNVCSATVSLPPFARVLTRAATAAGRYEPPTRSVPAPPASHEPTPPRGEPTHSQPAVSVGAAAARMRSYSASCPTPATDFPRRLPWQYPDPPNGSLTQLRRGPGAERQSGAPLAATNVKTAGSVCKRRDAVRLGRKRGFSPEPTNGPPSAAVRS